VGVGMRPAHEAVADHADVEKFQHLVLFGANLVLAAHPPWMGEGRGGGDRPCNDVTTPPTPRTSAAACPRTAWRRRSRSRRRARNRGRYTTRATECPPGSA